MLNVLLVEDDLDLAATVIQYLELENIACDHASNGHASLELLSRQRYDTIALDLNLPRLDGLSVCRRLRGDGEATPILMLTARDTLNDKLDGFRAGTDDYLVKPFELEELVARLYALAGRRSGQSQRLHCADLEMDLSARTIVRSDHLITLSPTGWRLLEVLLRASPDAVPRPSLERAVWGDEVPDSNSLKVHLHHLRKAVDAPFSRRLLHTIAGYGVALRDAGHETPDQS